MEPTTHIERQHPMLFYPPYRKLLHRALIDVDTQLGTYYVSVLLSLGQTENPLRHAGAGVGIREIMKELAYLKGLPRSEDTVTLGKKARELEGAWKKVCRLSSCRAPEGWSGEIDQHLRSFFERSEEFFAWYAAERPSAKQRNAEMLRNFDPAGIPLPTRIEDRRIKAWTEHVGYFNGAVHLTSKTEVFDERFSSLERFLLDLLKPRTFDDQDEIDAIIREGEGHDQA